MRIRTLALTGLGMAVSLGVAVSVLAQAPTVKRTVLQQVDVVTPGREAVTAKAEIPPNGSTGKHTHFGDEIGYVAEGTLMLDVDGLPSKTFTAGQAFHIPAGKVHNAMNHGTGAVTAVVTYVVEKGKPLTTPVP